MARNFKVYVVIIEYKNAKNRSPLTRCVDCIIKYKKNLAVKFKKHNVEDECKRYERFDGDELSELPKEITKKNLVDSIRN